jgi:quinoprotein glucose dehydrogenase
MMTRHGLLVAIGFIAALAPLTAGCETIKGPKPQGVVERFLPKPPGVTLTPWVTDLEAPWSLIFLPDGRALVSERPGRIRLIRDGVLASRAYANFMSGEGRRLNLFARGEGGLMGLAAHPDFPKAPFIYAMYTYRDGRGVWNRVIRLRDLGDRARFDKLIIGDIPGAHFHNGGRIAFGPDGMLYVATGEIFERRMAQDLAALGGKILRMTPDGDIPPDNPYPGSPIYSLGHRNPQGLAWHPRTGDLFASEHGPSGEVGFGAYDEVNVIRKGGNYGWPLVVGAPGRPGFIDPLIAWPEEAVPPSGMTFHQGDLFLATLRAQALIRIRLATGADGYRVQAIERWFARDPHEGVLGRLRDAVEGPDGRLYILTNNRDGRGWARPGDDKIYRVEIDG